MSQQAGMPYQGDTPSFAVDTSLGTTIEKYHVIQVSPTTDSAFLVGLCATADTQRAKAIGFAFKSWQYPPDPRIYLPTGRTSRDLSSGYDPTKYQSLAVRLEGVTWAKIEIPSGGSDVTVAHGDRMVPSNVVAGCVMPIPASTMTAATDVATIIAAYAADELEQNAILGRAMGLIHVPSTDESWGSLPSLQGATVAATLTALTNADTFGYVPIKIGKR